VGGVLILRAPGKMGGRGPPTKGGGGGILASPAKTFGDTTGAKKSKIFLLLGLLLVCKTPKNKQTKPKKDEFC